MLIFDVYGAEQGFFWGVYHGLEVQYDVLQILNEKDQFMWLKNSLFTSSDRYDECLNEFPVA